MVNLSMKQPRNWASMIVSLMMVLGVMIPTPLESIHSLGGNINFGLILPASILAMIGNNHFRLKLPTSIPVLGGYYDFGLK